MHNNIDFHSNIVLFAGVRATKNRARHKKPDETTHTIKNKTPETRRHATDNILPFTGVRSGAKLSLIWLDNWAAGPSVAMPGHYRIPCGKRKPGGYGFLTIVTAIRIDFGCGCRGSIR